MYREQQRNMASKLDFLYLRMSQNIPPLITDHFNVQLLHSEKALFFMLSRTLVWNNIQLSSYIIVNIFRMCSRAMIYVIDVSILNNYEIPAKSNLLCFFVVADTCTGFGCKSNIEWVILLYSGVTFRLAQERIADFPPCTILVSDMFIYTQYNRT